MKVAVMPLPELSVYLKEGMSYIEYRADFEKKAADVKAGIPVEILHPETLPLNWQRSTRVEKTFHLSEPLRNHLERMDKKSTWLILTEPWCGDSAQCLPALIRIAEASHGMIECKILLRDQHHELMDAFLTDGTRGIPKLIQLNSEGIITGTWGPRPEVADKLVKRIKKNPELAGTYREELHKWYAHDHCQALQSEILQLLIKA